MAQYEDKISGFLGSTQDGRPSEEQIQMSFQRMAEAAQQAILNPSEISDTACDFASTITRTLQGLLILMFLIKYIKLKFTRFNELINVYS